jgi:excisionase family DNA binding protein
MSDQSFEPLLTADEAAKLLRIHPKTVQKLAREGRLPSIRFDRFWRFRTSALDAWVASQQTDPSQPLP